MGVKASCEVGLPMLHKMSILVVRYDVLTQYS
jgi:hypothetical protein